MNSDENRTSSQGAAKVQEIYEKGRQSAQQGYEKAQDLAETAKEKSRQALERSKEALTTTDEWVHENPWMMLGIAVGLGLAIGLLISPRGKDWS